MEIRQRESKQAVVLELQGDLTYDNRTAFKDAVEQVKKTGCRHIIFDMEQVQFLDSSGLGLLALLSQNLKLSQVRLSLVNPQSYVREILALANISKLIPIHNSESDALTSKSDAAA
ncbi:Stage II sporulation protein [Nitrospira sp. KM1]|uniref:STAS domain-containing protein n=1 Tax=Nitrospira sp. KM1 TaxID=1936990 RepID=UPI0013A791AD|nr:STAS domain-containing protein [Nitrospira sp. KM1]BCA54750.1 Stage II sporulation protein [Nitrospira sp. KM1]